MAKGQKRSTKEAKKPKGTKKPGASAVSVAVVAASDSSQLRKSPTVRWPTTENAPAS